MKKIITTWKPIDQERFDDMLGVLPPAWQSADGFLLGEAWSCVRCYVTNEVRPGYRAFVETADGRFFEATGPMTVPEFRALSVLDVVNNLAEPQIIC